MVGLCICTLLQLPVRKLARLDLCGTKKELEGVDQKEAERPADRKPLEEESCGKGRFRRLGAVGCG